MFRAIAATILSIGVGAGAMAVGPRPAALAQEQKPAVRDVTPSGVIRVYRSESDARREPENPVPEDAKRIARARVDSDGTIIGEGISVRLYGIAALDPDRICQGAAGERWACGRRAFVALYNLVNRHDVACKMVEGGAPAGSATCWVDKTELSTWLLGNGLAELAPGVDDPRLRAAEQAAQKAKLGIWAERPLDDLERR